MEGKMRLKITITLLLAWAVFTSGPFPQAAAETQFTARSMKNVPERAIDEFRDFYEQIEKALREEDVGRMMTFYAEDYLHHGITKKQLKFMWLEMFTNFQDLYSVHIFTKVSVHGNDAILVCTGGLFGITKKGEDYTTVDQWVTQPHWLTKIGDKWKIIGGATHQMPRRRGGKLTLHPFF
jgi:ketosteroid isomerase-like protein